MTPGPPPLRFDHAAASVPDLEDAIAWYGRVLGFAVARRFELPGGIAGVAMLLRGDLRIELFEPRVGEPLPAARRHPDTDVQLHGNKHVGFREDDVERWAAWFEDQAVEVALRVAAPFGSAIFIRDNAGNLLEFLSRPALQEPVS